jgi:hypothetical protein
LICGDAGKLIVLPSPAIKRNPFHRFGILDAMWSVNILLSSRKKLSFILYLAIENAAPVTGLIDSVGNMEAKLYSADSLKR